MLNSNIQVYGNDCVIIIGENNLLKDSILWLEDRKSSIIIGNNNKFCGKVHIGVVEKTRVSIGNNCLFSSEIYITTTDSHSIIDISTGKRINPSLDVNLGNHVWVGHKATILKGVSIADNTIIGACALVTKNIDEQNTVVVGNPARIVRHNVNWDEHRI